MCGGNRTITPTSVEQTKKNNDALLHCDFQLVHQSVQCGNNWDMSAAASSPNMQAVNCVLGAQSNLSCRQTDP